MGLFSQWDRELRSVRPREAPRTHQAWMGPGALQLATAVTPDKVGHLVLVIDTTEGDWVLDNLRADVERWRDLPYRWVARQQGAAMEDWVSVARRS